MAATLGHALRGLGLWALVSSGCAPDLRLILLNIPDKAEKLYVMTHTEIRGSDRMSIAESKTSAPQPLSVSGLSSAERVQYTYGLVLSGQPSIQSSGQVKQTTVSIAATQGSTILSIGDSSSVTTEESFVDVQLDLAQLAAPPRPDLTQKSLDKDVFIYSAKRYLTLDPRTMQPIFELDVLGWNFPPTATVAVTVLKCASTGQPLTLVGDTTASSSSQLIFRTRTQGMMPGSRPQPLDSCIIDIVAKPDSTIKMEVTASGSVLDSWMQGPPVS
ncbi:MAG TPA: hypothetical protein PKI49_05015 [Pseudomonadota bacterium]|nr:hypothetical protein [Pseudomonadota bacterium]HNI59182.1 hypothetical protein [Pseudomonadota bacterium]HNN52152.1 hypothetical protein [Pseudomonadota bacterium]HNO67848.1 hypothetical protein [Pseudomonadota bacterium]